MRPDTPVRREDADPWRPYAEVRRPAEPAPAGATGQRCAECGLAFPPEEMVRFGDQWVCAACKPRYFQRLREGGAATGSRRPAGFWIRFAAQFVDGLVTGVLGMLLTFPAAMLAGGDEDPRRALAVQGVSTLLQFAFAIAYETWFVGRYGATPGKMACGLRVVTAEGQSVTYGRAFGRYFGKLLSGMILGIGYLMVAFDDQKRGLHDRICETRVVRAR